ncbi:hypothetical protein CSHISOI_11476 [Colletotrichum shisoi]|uniref:Uncharacterized protein n=1 Tax=Colletotrichum shisoi TaxID=2078593 RepID=A0A5Q4BB92_9PEZI|nr:hypothetical protein CSHISOI_11476 [Colletotrichum shisoi]
MNAAIKINPKDIPNATSKMSDLNMPKKKPHPCRRRKWLLGGLSPCSSVAQI